MVAEQVVPYDVEPVDLVGAESANPQWGYGGYGHNNGGHGGYGGYGGHNHGGHGGMNELIYISILLKIFFKIDSVFNWCNSELIGYGGYGGGHGHGGHGGYGGYGGNLSWRNAFTTNWATNHTWKHIIIQSIIWAIYNNYFLSNLQDTTVKLHSMKLLFVLYSMKSINKEHIFTKKHLV